MTIFTKRTVFRIHTDDFQCALAASQLKDILWVSLNHAGNVLGVSQTIYGTGNCRDQSHFQQVDALEEFNTDVVVKHSELVPV